MNKAIVGAVDRLGYMWCMKCWDRAGMKRRFSTVGYPCAVYKGSAKGCQCDKCDEDMEPKVDVKIS